MVIDYNDKKLSASVVYKTLKYENGKIYVFEQDINQTEEKDMVKYFEEFKSIILDICKDINEISLEYISSKESIDDQEENITF